MAQAQLMGAKERRETLAQDSPKLAQAAQAFISAGRWGEALECLEAAGDRKGLEQARAWAVEQGDLFIYRRALYLLESEPAAGELDTLAAAAEAAGRQAYARQARAMLPGSREA